MAILTDQNPFTGTPADSDVIHIVDVSDTTDNPAGTSFKIPLSGLTNYFSSPTYWLSGSTAGITAVTSSNETVYTSNIDNSGSTKSGGLHVRTNVDTTGVTYSVTENDYYLRSQTTNGNTTYNLSSTPPDGQILVVSKQGTSGNKITIYSPSAASIRACGDNSTYNVIEITGTNATISLLYDDDLGAWIVMNNCGGTITYGTTI